MALEQELVLWHARATEWYHARRDFNHPPTRPSDVADAMSSVCACSSADVDASNRTTSTFTRYTTTLSAVSVLLHPALSSFLLRLAARLRGAHTVQAQLTIPEKGGVKVASFLVALAHLPQLRANEHAVRGLDVQPALAQRSLLEFGREAPVRDHLARV